MTLRVGDDYTKEARKVEVIAAKPGKPDAATKKQVREMLKGDDGEQVAIRLSAPARIWLTTYKVMETEAEPDTQGESAPPPPAQDNKPA